MTMMIYLSNYFLELEKCLADYIKFLKIIHYRLICPINGDVWAEAIVTACSNCSLLNFTGEKWRRYAAGNSDKETALKTLVEYIGIDPSDVVAFGDDINDLGMLKSAGTAVAVSNAIDEVKVVADHITESNDQDGVAKFLERTLLV